MYARLSMVQSKQGWKPYGGHKEREEKDEGEDCGHIGAGDHVGFWGPAKIGRVEPVTSRKIRVSKKLGIGRHDSYAQHTQ
jgi:hypothetical protein